MAHPQQRRFTEGVKAKFPAAFVDVRALDVGSLCVNGDNRDLFSGGSYLGIDVVPGKNVDRVIGGHELDHPDGHYDTIISTECLEHDLHVFATLKNIRRLLRSGGLFVMTCATTGRAEHGTARSSPQDAPGLPWDYYRNVTRADVLWAYSEFKLMEGWAEYEFSEGRETFDLYLWAIRA